MNSIGANLLALRPFAQRKRMTTLFLTGCFNGNVAIHVFRLMFYRRCFFFATRSPTSLDRSPWSETCWIL